MQLLSVRETARRLGVHENTIRNWEARGIIRAHRLPGSGYRRFEARRVNQLVQQMSGPEPGADLIVSGLADLEQSLVTVPALLVSIGAPRLRRLGVVIDHAHESPEKRLYATLAAEDPLSAHSRYNALIRRLVSYERAAECAS